MSIFIHSAHVAVHHNSPTNMINKPASHALRSRSTTPPRNFGAEKIPNIFLHFPLNFFPESNGTVGSGCRIEIGFLVTTIIFLVIGIIALLCTRICCNRGPSANLLLLTLVITATVCCWMMWAIVYLAQTKPLIVPILSDTE